MPFLPVHLPNLWLRDIFYSFCWLVVGKLYFCTTGTNIFHLSQNSGCPISKLYFLKEQLVIICRLVSAFLTLNTVSANWQFVYFNEAGLRIQDRMFFVIIIHLLIHSVLVVRSSLLQYYMNCWYFLECIYTLILTSMFYTILGII